MELGLYRAFTVNSHLLLKTSSCLQIDLVTDTGFRLLFAVFFVLCLQAAHTAIKLLSMITLKCYLNHIDVLIT